MHRSVFRSRPHQHPRLLRALFVIALASVGPLSPSGLRAQGAVRDRMDAVPPIGSLVRVTLPPDLRGRQRTRDAVVLASSPDSMRLAWRGGDTASLALLEMRRLQLGLGPHRQIAASIGVGALVGGAGLGLLTALTTKDDLFFSRGELAAAAGLVGALGGAVIGGVVGTFRTSERWRTVYRAGERRGVAVTPLLGRTRGLHVRVAF